MTGWLIGAGLLAVIATLWAVSDWRAKARRLNRELESQENAEKADEIRRDVDRMSDDDVADELSDWRRD